MCAFVGRSRGEMVAYIGFFSTFFWSHSLFGSLIHKERVKKPFFPQKWSWNWMVFEFPSNTRSAFLLLPCKAKTLQSVSAFWKQNRSSLHWQNQLKYFVFGGWESLSAGRWTKEHVSALWGSFLPIRKDKKRGSILVSICVDFQWNKRLSRKNKPIAIE